VLWEEGTEDARSVGVEGFISVPIKLVSLMMIRRSQLRAVGPAITDARFHHIMSYAGYLQALSLRVAFVHIVKGTRGFTAAGERSNLRESSTFLRKLVQNIYGPLVVQSKVNGTMAPVITCESVTLKLIDNSLFDKTQN
jgi:hypothetical protein